MNAQAFDFKSGFLKIASERGFLNDCTDFSALDSALSGPPVAAFVGFDATADSLHVGHLLSIMALRRFQQAGHKPIVLVGGGTTLIGDPSFRKSDRPMLDEISIAANAAGIRKSFSRLLTFGDGPSDAVMVDNAEWLKGMDHLGFMRDVGRHFTVSRMMSFDSVKSRMDSGLTFMEFGYMLLQALDFVELSKRHGCILQMGGSDQWGNIVNGIELGRRMHGNTLFGLTTPLLTTASGEKMGKTASGAVWLNEERLVTWKFRQFWRNVHDSDVSRFLRLFTDLPLDEIGRLESLRGAEINAAKDVLADEVTRLCRGEESALQASKTAQGAFSKGIAVEGLPVVEVSSDSLSEGISVFESLFQSGLCDSKSAARRLIKDGGARLNGVVVSDERAVLSSSDFSEGDLLLSAGKRKKAAVKIVA